MLNLFYEEPDGDRWLPFDRYPRRAIRRLLRGAPRPGGQRRVFLNLCAGLDRIGIPYRINDYRFATNNSSELACIIGKPFLLDKMQWRNPILFGAAGYSHPVDDINLLGRLQVKKILVPGPWMREMCRPHWGAAVDSWSVGIDTGAWRPEDPQKKAYDVLLYDKVRWDHDDFESSLIEPIRAVLRKQGRSFIEIRYGSYREEEFRIALSRCRTMIFLCEHETQGIAYQQALSCAVPMLAWDRGGVWRDPAYFPDKVTFEPVTSVPYWDERCGVTFRNAAEFQARWNLFWDGYRAGEFDPRAYVLETLTLAACARRYVAFVSDLL